MKSIIQLLVVALIVLLITSCGNPAKPSLMEMREEKMTLIQVLSPTDKVKDVYGDAVQMQPQYYVYTKSRELVPLSDVVEGGEGRTIGQSLMEQGLMGRTGSDTVSIGVGYTNTTVTVRQFRLKNVQLSPAKLN
jgi:hypothetical protein